jgi:GR25 family glycosyltransferase involved in LPS biosynthesis
VDSDLLTGNKVVTPTLKSLAIGHIKCIEEANIAGYKTILICEDDIKFTSNVIFEFNSFISKIPDDWQFLQLGNQYWATHWLTRYKISDNLYRFFWGTGSHCIGIRNTIYKKTIDYLSKFNEPIDKSYYELFKEYKAYCPERFLANALSRTDYFDYNSDEYNFKSSIIHDS